MVAMGQLSALGIRKDADFAPDDTTREVLRRAAAQVLEGFVLENLNIPFVYWPNTHWGLSIQFGPKTAFTFQTPDALEIDERAFVFFLAYAPPKSLGSATFYVAASRDADGDPLLGDRTYRLRIPPDVPVRQYWAATVYDLETSAFLRDAPRLAIDSYGDVETNEDGSIDVYFGPAAPPGRERNWIATVPGKGWFTFFRFYGPEPAVFDKSWGLTDIERIAPES
jgi:hypothetical protein